MNNLINLLREGKTQFHVVEYSKQTLLDNGFTMLSMYDNWNLNPGKYFVQPFSSMLVAFIVGNVPKALRISACHTDFPMLKLKSKPELNKSGYLMANVEPYGGLILSTWFDRPLGLAGKILSKGKDAFSPVTTLFDSKKPVFTLPNLAPHLKKNANSDIDKQKEVIPLCGLAANNDINSSSDYILDYISSETKLPKDAILDYDLYLYIFDEPMTIGLDDKLLSSPRIDNISSVSAILDSLCNSTINDSICIGAFFDNEEIGSRSKQGADSLLLRNIIDKILPNDALYKNAFCLSIDVAHAAHPNYMEKSDITNKIMLGNGFALKTSASQRYVTDSEAGATITALCQEKNIKLQKMVNNSNIPGGQTLGPIISSYLPVKSVDIGIPMLAMHSARELIHEDDYLSLKQLIKEFYEY